MKKYLFVFAIIMLSFMLAGCGNSNSILGGNSGTKTCTNTSTDEDGYKTIDTMVISYKNNKVSKVEETSISEMDSDYIDFSFNVLQAFAEKLNEVNGFEIKYSKESSNQVKMYMEVDFTKINVDNIKETMGDLYSEDDVFYSKTDITIDDFISNNLEGYVCK